MARTRKAAQPAPEPEPVDEDVDALEADDEEDDDELVADDVELEIDDAELAPGDFDDEAVEPALVTPGADPGVVVEDLASLEVLEEEEDDLVEDADLIVRTGVEDEEDDPEVEGLRDDEFICANCFLVKSKTQLADARKHLCRDCV